MLFSPSNTLQLILTRVSITNNELFKFFSLALENKRQTEPLCNISIKWIFSLVLVRLQPHIVERGIRAPLMAKVVSNEWKWNCRASWKKQEEIRNELQLYEFFSFFLSSALDECSQRLNVSNDFFFLFFSTLRHDQHSVLIHINVFQVEIPPPFIQQYNILHRVSAMKKLAVVPNKRKEGKVRERMSMAAKFDISILFWLRVTTWKAFSTRWSCFHPPFVVCARFQLFPSYSFWLKSSILVWMSA